MYTYITLQKGCFLDKYVLMSPHYSRTPLHWATVCESPDAVRALLTLGGTHTFYNVVFSESVYMAPFLIANTGVKDFSEMTAMDYATQKELHYCALLLSQAEGFDDPDK